MVIRVYRILERTKMAGPGWRFCLWVQGCGRHCEGCMAEETWDYDGGAEMSTESVFERISAVKDIEGITFLGGEPLDQAAAVYELVQRCRPFGLSVTVFTGYTYEELLSKNDRNINDLLSATDLLIDGPFIQRQFDLSRPWVGSANQQYRFLTEKYSESDIKDVRNQIEVRISKNGETLVNGMGNFDKIKKLI